jgi:hypothetical protein
VLQEHVLPQLLLPNMTHVLLLLLPIVTFVQLPFEDCKTDADCEFQSVQLLLTFCLQC